MKRVLIAEPEGLLGKAIKKQLTGECEVMLCATGNEVLRQVRMWEPDILLMYMHLPDIEAMSILHLLYNFGVPAQVITIMRCADEFSLYQMEKLAVKCSITIPCRYEFVTMQIQKLLNDHDIDWIGEWCVENEIDLTLQILGFRRGPSRYRCVYEAIRIRYENPDCAMKELYIDVAGICGGNYQRIEKAIRSAIADAYICGDKPLWDFYFVSDPRREKPYPSNEDFIASVVASLARRERLERRRALAKSQAE